MRTLRCKKCKGVKYIGEEYVAFGTKYVDVTCMKCGHSKDIDVESLKKYLKALGYKGDKRYV
jgi:RNase P subunit RPR2